MHHSSITKLSEIIGSDEKMGMKAQFIAVKIQATSKLPIYQKLSENKQALLHSGQEIPLKSCLR